MQVAVELPAVPISPPRRQGRRCRNHSRSGCHIHLQDLPQNPAAEERCDLVVIGAGMAALHVLSRLPDRLLKVPGHGTGRC